MPRPCACRPFKKPALCCCRTSGVPWRWNSRKRVSSRRSLRPTGVPRCCCGDALSRAFPNHGIIGEEAEDAVNPEADYLWFLDPLDGTTNFAAGLPAFAVSMGLCFRGVPVLGVVAVPWEGPGGTIFRAHVGRRRILQ